MNDRDLKTIRLQTVGCRLNQYETEKIGAELYPYGFRQAGKNESADLTIINTCTVTHRADSDSRYLLRRAHRKSPEGRIIAVGCYVEHDPERLSAIEGVDMLIDNTEKADIVNILRRKFPDLFTREPDGDYVNGIGQFINRNRTWMKISDGCNQKCTFCLVTIVRGPLINRSASEIIVEVNKLASLGYRELVLTGINIGYYRDKERKPNVKNLAELCKLILSETDMYRIRLSSVEPQAITDDLLDVLANSDGRLCRNLHLPLQSASDSILSLMRRPYNRAKFLERTSAIRQASPDTLIGADTIVGFPGETENDFEQTLSLCESGAVDYLHVFSYSDRPGTAAAEMPNKVKPETIRNRNKTLRAISHRMLTGVYQHQVGKTLEVISEHKSNSEGSHFAISDNYLRVKLPSGVETGREIVRVKILAAKEDYLESDLITI
ncbi:MAG: tRNA (N(6)-L-threonylcarbamoyladenosine(37)-C(2))-methylthiotransferase MtaB [candidate division Zixibacteria bacterium]|nr:tRNA (N(6)-L-threonylcarbamoyladenosine(37)-C(2))-methylthiotransferase MtaB [candidate division Zixibacteria bacterium]